MPGYFIATYDVTDPDTYAKYNPGSMPTIMETIGKHGGKVLAATGDAHWLEGQRHVVVVIEFPDVESGVAWRNDPQYAEVLPIRLGATTNIVEMVVPHFEMPG